MHVSQEDTIENDIVIKHRELLHNPEDDTLKLSYSDELNVFYEVRGCKIVNCLAAIE